MNISTLFKAIIASWLLVFLMLFFIVYVTLFKYFLLLIAFTFIVYVFIMGHDKE